MAFVIAAAVNSTLPGSVRVAVTGDPGVASAVVRIDGAKQAQPVRNFTGTGSGLVQVIDCEAPLGRPVSYSLIAAGGTVLASSGQVQCPAPADGWSLIRSVLRPHVAWMWAEPADETGIKWATSTTSWEIVGSDTPVVVGEVRQRRSGTMAFLVRSTDEADRLVALMQDGSTILVRHSPGTGRQVRDTLMVPLDVQETRWGRDGWRIVAVQFVSTGFVPGETDTPPSSWDFAALRDSAATFGELAGRYETFASMALDIRKGGDSP